MVTVAASWLLGRAIYFYTQGNMLAMLDAEPTSILTSTQLMESASEKDEPDLLVQLPIKLLFGGDLMFDRNIRAAMTRDGVDQPLRELTKLFNQYDAVIANLEGPITTNPSRSLGSVPGSTDNFFFTFEPEIVPMLAANNLRILNLGNNHITNFGHDGVEQTKTALAKDGLSYFGFTSLEVEPAERVHYQQFGQHQLAFVGYNQFAVGGFEAALADIAAATVAAELVVVMPHWGNEYVPEAGAVIQEQAHQFIDAGADLIIGGHPHVVQQQELYRGKKIYYSLGNFVFDQYFSPETQTGLLVGVEIAPDGQLIFTEMSIMMLEDGRTVLREAETAI